MDSIIILTVLSEHSVEDLGPIAFLVLLFQLIEDHVQGSTVL